MSQRILKNWFLPLLILLTFMGGKMADACDFSDYHRDLEKSHLECSDKSANYADDKKYKVKVLSSFAPVEWIIVLPPVAPAPRGVVNYSCASVTFPVSLPARAPPA